jgi:hypothetical protein
MVLSHISLRVKIRREKRRVELVALDTNCRCGIAENYGLVPSELGIGYCCEHMIEEMIWWFFCNAK